MARVAAKPWHEFVAERIFQPLQMQCYAGPMPEAALQNVALPYSFSGTDGFAAIKRNAINGAMLMSAAAGGIVCSASDMSKWLGFLLSSAGTTTAAPVSRAQLAQMWAPHTIMGVSATDRELHFTNFSAYGLGWRMADMHGVKVVHHTGTLSGFQAHVVLVPDRQLGLVVLNNGSNSGARQAVVQTVLKHYLAPELQRDWVGYYAEQQQRRAQGTGAAALPVGTGEVLLALQDYAGTYADRWFGAISITQTETGLSFQSARMQNLQGILEPFADHSFVVRWHDANVARPALIHFQLNNRRQVTGFRLEPYVAEPGERHEYRDMQFLRSKL
ncbi:serine hydrolase [Alishewanella longhuensis]